VCTAVCGSERGVHSFCVSKHGFGTAKIEAFGWQRTASATSLEDSVKSEDGDAEDTDLHPLYLPKPNKIAV